MFTFDANNNLNVNSVAPATQPVSGTVIANQGTANTAANAWPVKVTDGTTVATVIAATAALKTDLSSVAGTAVVTSLAGVQEVGIVAHNGNIMSAGVGASTSPVSGLAVLTVSNTTAPAPTAAQSVAIQSDYSGSVFVKPVRRSQTAASKATITNSAVAVTVMPAQAAGIFADISSLVVTVTPAATVSLPFTLTLSDGTATYVWDMETGALATSPADGTLLNLALNPPIPATAAATAWTIATNVATVTVHATSVAVLQKAS